jgi:phosphoribosylaminoimidazole-succinocarboxamide synthase
MFIDCHVMEVTVMPWYAPDKLT